MDGAGSERRRGGGIKQEVLSRNPVQFSPPPDFIVIPALDAGIFFFSLIEKCKVFLRHCEERSDEAIHHVRFHLREYDIHFHTFCTQPPADQDRFFVYLPDPLPEDHGCVLCNILYCKDNQKQCHVSL